MKRIGAPLSVLLLALLACNDATSPLDVASVCQRPVGTGVYGCALMTGRVEAPTNEGQPGALVTALPYGEPVAGAVFLSDTVATDTLGSYRLHVLVKSPPATDTLVDPVDVLVVVTLPPPDGSPAGTPPMSMDAAVRLHLRPAGASLDTVEVPTMQFSSAYGP